MRRRWVKIVAVAVASVLALSAVLYFVVRYEFTKIVIAEPGSTGRRVEQSGVFANYFPAGSHAPAVLLLGGSEGGIGRATIEVATSLQADGYSVLAPSYFGAPGQPKTLELIPLETFDRALTWLSARPDVDPSRIAIAGVSKGAEAALLVATRHPEIRAVVAGVPSSVVWPGISFPGLPTRSSWSAGGRPLVALPYGAFRLGMLAGNVGSVYRDGLKRLAQHPKAVIPIEKIKAPVLLVCRKADKLWPSCVMSRQIAARAKAKGGPSVKVLAYADAGHASLGPPSTKSVPSFARIVLGGTDSGDRAARADGWPKILAFVRTALRRSDA